MSHPIPTREYRDNEFDVQHSDELFEEMKMQDMEEADIAYQLSQLKGNIF